MKNSVLLHTSRFHRGFSLFEMIMAISLLGVLVSISVPSLFQTDSVYGVRNRRNAQELAAVCSAAQSAGLNFVQGEDLMETIRSLTRGGMPSRGAMKGRMFVVPGLSEEDLAGAAKYLGIKDGELRYSTSEKPIGPGNQQM